MEKKVSIGERLKSLRNEAHLSQNEVAQLCFIARTTYAQYETNLAYPPQEIQIVLSKFYKVSLDYLNGLTDFKLHNPSEVEFDDQKYKSIPLLSLPDLTAIRNIKTPYEKVQRGSFGYIYSPCKFSEYNINKNDLLLIRRSTNFRLGDLLLLQVNNNFFIGRCLTTESNLVLYSADFKNGFEEFEKDKIIIVGRIVEVTISI